MPIEGADRLRDGRGHGRDRKACRRACSAAFRSLLEPGRPFLTSSWVGHRSLTTAVRVPHVGLEHPCKTRPRVPLGVQQGVQRRELPGTAHRQLHRQWTRQVGRSGVECSEVVPPFDPRYTWGFDDVVDGGGPTDCGHRTLTATGRPTDEATIVGCHGGSGERATSSLREFVRRARPPRLRRRRSRRHTQELRLRDFPRGDRGSLERT